MSYKLCEFTTTPIGDGNFQHVCHGVENGKPLTRIGQEKYYRQCNCDLAGPVEDRSQPCVHRGADTMRLAMCESCRGQVQIKIFHCAKHAECTIETKLPNIACCGSQFCPDYEALK